jgi:hypothetical protein
MRIIDQADFPRWYGQGEEERETLFKGHTAKSVKEEKINE